MTGAIILAAGASLRLGVPKQTLLYKGKTLLEHTIDAAVDAHCNPIVVVLGAHEEHILPNIQEKAVVIVHNGLWQQGMASSIVAGLNAILSKDTTINEILIMLCDQPFADALLLQNIMAQKIRSKKGIVACAYAATVGVPVLFDKKYIDELRCLSGEEGAKKLLFKYKEDVAVVTFEKGIVDIDTAQDVASLKNSE